MSPSRGTPITPQASFARKVYFFGALGELMFGYDVGVIGVALLFISQEMQLTPTTQGLVVSALLAGAAVGVGCAGILADRFGRRPVTIAMAAVFSIGGLMGAEAPNVEWLIAARAVMGIGVGASAVVVMVYLAEIAPTEHRGRIAALGQTMLVCGILLSYIVDYLLAPWGAWRWMIGLSVPPSLLLLIGMFFMPESPRWLVQVGRSEDAHDVLVKLGRRSTAEAEIFTIQRSLSGAGMGRASLAHCLRTIVAPGVRRAWVISVGLAVLVQLLGVNTIIYYAPTVLMQAGFGQRGAIVANLSIGVVNVLLTLAALTVIDRVGRRKLLLWGSGMMTAAMIFLGVAGVSPASPTASWTTFAGMLVFLGAFAISWGACVRVVISELLPQNVRGSAMGLVLVLNWVTNFCVGMFFPLMLAEFGQGGTYMVFAGVGVLALGFVALCVPETKGRSLEEIQASLRGG